MIPNLIELLNNKNDSDDAKSIIYHIECSVCDITPNESSKSFRACKEFFRRSNYFLS